MMSSEPPAMGHSAEAYKIFFSCRMFEGLDHTLLQPVLEKCAVRWLEPNEILLAPDQTNHHLYVLLSGEIFIFLDEIDSANYFTIEAGDCIGEMSIIQHRKVSAYVIAGGRSHLLVIPEAVFWGELSVIPNMMRNMLTMLSRRMRKQSSVTREILEQQLRYELLEKEITAAGKLQANIVPQDDPLFPDYRQIDVYAVMHSAREVGGDFYDAFVVNKNHICIAIGDVSGKGLPAALFMVRAISLLRMGLRKKKRFDNLMKTVNRMLIKNNPEGNFVTMFVGLLNVKSGRFQFFNGGHNPPLMAKKGTSFELIDVPVGALMGFSNQVRFEKGEIRLNFGDTLVLYTDGVTEAENEEQSFFGLERTIAVLNQARQAKKAGDLVESLSTAVTDFAGDAPQSDDLTLLALRYLRT